MKSSIKQTIQKYFFTGNGSQSGIINRFCCQKHAPVSQKYVNEYSEFIMVLPSIKGRNQLIILHT